MRFPAGLALGAAAVIAAGSIVSALIIQRRNNPRDRERRRRELVSRQGRAIEGYVTKCEDGFIEYSYHWRGVRYETAQDISDFASNLSGLTGFAGPATIKFLGSRPVDSIVLAEKWSGIPEVRRQAGGYGS
jgi:hypothetical protein